MAINWILVVMEETTVRYLFLDLYRIADAVCMNSQRENENEYKTLFYAFEKVSMINMTSVTEILLKGTQVNS